MGKVRSKRGQDMKGWRRGVRLAFPDCSEPTWRCASLEAATQFQCSVSTWGRGGGVWRLAKNCLHISKRGNTHALDALDVVGCTSLI